MKLFLLSAFALTIIAMPGGHETGDGHAHAVVEGGDHDMMEASDAHSMEEYNDMTDTDDYGHGKMGQRYGNDGIVINNNVGGGCDMEGVAERVARKVVEIMMEHQNEETKNGNKKRKNLPPFV